MKAILAAAAILGLAGPALAQTGATPPGARDTTVVRDSGNTGGGGDTVIARGATGADTADTNSAAAGNASQPERRVPQGSGGGGSR